MNKSVVVMETPEDCESCVLHGGIFHSFCKINCRYIEDLSAKPDWCPLMDLPEKYNGDYPANTSDTGFAEGWNQCIDEITGGEIMMIDLTGKNVFVRTREEYLSVLKIARFQGFKWAREDHLNPIEIPFPNLLNFYSSKVVTYRDNEKTLCEASEIVEDEEKIKDAAKLVRTFAEYPDRTELTDSFIKSLKLLADTVESQIEEVK